MNCPRAGIGVRSGGIRCFLYLPETAGSPRRTPESRQPMVCRGGARNDSLNRERFYSCLTEAFGITRTEASSGQQLFPPIVEG